MRPWRCICRDLLGQPVVAEEQYYVALRNQDYAKAYSYLGPELQAKLSQAAFTQQAQQQDETLGKMTRYTEDNFPFGDPATITVTVTRTQDHLQSASGVAARRERMEDHSL